MSSKVLAETPEAGLYRSGVAARLAGIPVETLRVWERRHGVVRPRLSNGRQRLYSAKDVRRLTLLKRLADMGHAIGVIAPLSTEVLVGMHALGNPSDAQGLSRNDAPARAARTALVGPLLNSRRMAEVLSGSALEVIGSCANAIDAISELHDVRAEIVVIELPTLGDDSVAFVDKVKSTCGAAKAIVLYRFAPSAIIRRMRAAGDAVARSSSEVIELASICLNLLRLPDRTATSLSQAAAPPPSRFDEGTLSAFLEARNSVYCECPHQLAELVLSLGAFERYSAECANRGPNDALLHRDLQHTAGHARAMLEVALIRVALAEGLPLPARPISQQ